MQPIRKTAKNASTRASNPATAQAVRNLENPGDQSPEIPYGGNLRVRNFLFPPSNRPFLTVVAELSG